MFVSAPLLPQGNPQSERLARGAGQVGPVLGVVGVAVVAGDVGHGRTHYQISRVSGVVVTSSEHHLGRPQIKSLPLCDGISTSFHMDILNANSTMKGLLPQ